VQVREEHEPLAEARILGRDRLLDLEHELGVAPDLVDGADPRTDRGVGVVGERAPLPRALLDQHVVAVPRQLERPCRRERDAVFVGLDLLGDADLHERRRTLSI
jgi:hypothetical protein